MSDMECKAKGCDLPAKVAGLCGGHYKRHNKGLPVDNVPVRSRKQCSVEGCCEEVTTASALPFCHEHRHRRATGDTRPRQRGYGQEHCNFKGCTNKHRSQGWCSSHYAQWRRDPDDMYPIGSRKGSGRYTNAQGYVLVFKPDWPTSQKSGWIMEHRYVMEVELGRSLFPDENVHHINGQRDDNRISNLELWSSSQPSGQRVEDKLAWAREMLARYEKPRKKVLRRANVA